MLDWLLDPWSDPLGTRALVEVLLLGATGGALGCWIVFYRLAYSAESLAHALLPGLVLAALAGRDERLGGDTGVAVAVSALFGLGALLALSPATPAGLSGLLFGDVLGVSDGDLWAAARLAARRLGTMLVVGTAVAIGAGVGGLYLSYYADTAAGASIAGMLVLAYAGLALTTRRSAGTIPAA